MFFLVITNEGEQGRTWLYRVGNSYSYERFFVFMCLYYLDSRYVRIIGTRSSAVQLGVVTFFFNDIYTSGACSPPRAIKTNPDRYLRGEGNSTILLHAAFFSLPRLSPSPLPAPIWRPPSLHIYLYCFAVFLPSLPSFAIIFYDESN